MTENELDDLIASEASALAARPYEDGLRDGAAQTVAFLRDAGHPEIADALDKGLAGGAAALAGVLSMSKAVGVRVTSDGAVSEIALYSKDGAVLWKWTPEEMEATS